MTPGEKASPSTVMARDRPGGGGITLPETDVGVAREEIVWRASSELMTSELAAAELMTSETGDFGTGSKFLCDIGGIFGGFCCFGNCCSFFYRL